MPRFAWLIVALALIASVSAAADFPHWAYPVNPPGGAPAPDNGRARHVPDSVRSFTRTQLSTIAGPVSDWHPEEHPPMPAIVANGRPPQVYACAYCHLPSGAGRPENTNLTGLTPTYFKQQVLAFKNGGRPGSDPKRAPQTGMIALAKELTGDEIAVAAAYFAAIKPTSFVKVVEADSVPQTTVAGWMQARLPGGRMEPIGNRIVEIADDFARFEDRDSRTPYTAYVPTGSLQRGASLVASGGDGRTIVCAICHGPDLRGMADIPPIGGRSPSFLFRQLYDIREGNRTGGAAILMKAVVANLTDEDMVAIAAYVASRAP